MPSRSILQAPLHCAWSKIDCGMLARRLSGVPDTPGARRYCRCAGARVLACPWGNRDVALHALAVVAGYGRRTCEGKGQGAVGAQRGAERLPGRSVPDIPTSPCLVTDRVLHAAAMTLVRIERGAKVPFGE